jgi:hypothetical protein
MRNDRRVFLAGWIAVAGAPLWLRGQSQQPGQSPPGRQQLPDPNNPPIPTHTFPDDTPTSDPDAGPVVNPRAILQQDRKDLQHDAASLLQMAQDLKKQVDALDTTEVLSLDLVHKAENIEKLAHQMKTLMQER